MSHYAKINNQNEVIEVIVAEQDFIDTLEGTWIQTSYTGSIRKNFAGVGYTYDSTKDAFIPPKLYNSWTLDETTCMWEAPVNQPDDDNFYKWNEETLSWELFE